MQLPIIDLTPFLDHLKKNGTLNTLLPDEVRDICVAIVKALEDFSAVLVRSEHFDDALDRAFLDLMVRYFQQDDDVLLQDERADLGHQIGYTPPFAEQALEPDSGWVASLVDGNRPTPEAWRVNNALPKGDPKSRFFIPYGMKPEQTNYPMLNAQPVIPAAFADVWESATQAWGDQMSQTLDTVRIMLAFGYRLPWSHFLFDTTAAPHLIAPTGSDLDRFGTPGTMLAGCHQDLNELTIHSQGNAPGLFIWTRKGVRMPVRIPKGHRLIQAGMQVEYRTAGCIRAGWHEVVAVPEMAPMIEAARAQGVKPVRVSATFFGHTNSDADLAPRGIMADHPDAGRYPSFTAGDMVLDQLLRLGLLKAPPPGFTPRNWTPAW